MGSADNIFTTANWHAFDQSPMGERRCGKRTCHGCHCSSLGVDNCFQGTTTRGEYSQLPTYSSEHQHLWPHAATCCCCERIGNRSSLEAEWLRRGSDNDFTLRPISWG